MEESVNVIKIAPRTFCVGRRPSKIHPRTIPNFIYQVMSINITLGKALLTSIIHLSVHYIQVTADLLQQCDCIIRPYIEPTGSGGIFEKIHERRMVKCDLGLVLFAYKHYGVEIPAHILKLQLG